MQVLPHVKESNRNILVAHFLCKNEINYFFICSFQSHLSNFAPQNINETQLVKRKVVKMLFFEIFSGVKVQIQARSKLKKL